MNIVALQTARRGSQTVKNKNLLEIGGKSLLLHNLDYVLTVSRVSHVYISTDILSISEILGKREITIINRPEHLCGSNASHYETIIHGVYQIEKDLDREIDILVVLLGNNLSAWPNDIDKAIDLLETDSQINSVMSVAEYNMFNPFRVYNKDQGCYIKPFLTQKEINTRAECVNINDKNSAGTIYYFTGSFWVIRRETLFRNDGLAPFPWLGRRIAYIEQSPECMEIDAGWQEAVLKTCFSNRSC